MPPERVATPPKAHDRHGRAAPAGGRPLPRGRRLSGKAPAASRTPNLKKAPLSVTENDAFPEG